MQQEQEALEAKKFDHVKVYINNNYTSKFNYTLY